MTSFVPRLRPGFILPAVFALIQLAPIRLLPAQSRYGTPAISGPGSASAIVRRASEKTDPVGFLLDRKKPLSLKTDAEDSLKALRKEMRQMQEVIYKELDRAAPKESKSASGRGQLSEDVAKAVARLQEIQDAYRDRARAMLTSEQRTRADSLERVWKGTDLLKRDAKPIIPIPPP